MQKIQSKLLIIFSILFFLSGCEEFKDIDKDVFVSMIGIDHSDDNEKPFKVTLKLFVPTSSFRQKPEANYTYLVETAETISEAIRILETHIDKELDFGHLKLIVLGEELVKENKNKEVLDFLLRRPDIQLISWVTVGRPNAEEIVTMVPKGETAAYPSLYNYFDGNGTESPYIVTMFLFDYRRRMMENGLDPIIPIVEISENESTFTVNKSIVLKNRKTPYELDPLNTFIFNSLSMNVKIADIEVKQGNEHFVAKIDTIKAKNKVKKQGNNKFSLDVNVELIGYIVESQNALNSRDLPKYSKLLEKEAKENLESFFHELQSEGLDPIGFGLKYKAQTFHHKRMSIEEWNETYKNAEVNIKVTASLKSTGSIQ
ncbi:Ger(x)C family germination protein [Ureibacillus xyleni]|uniref:Ger(X)C family germination protein n=1 Tax=Ureibacillus xyleni TaxID=614648 RepID=A0A285T1F7_9BACL|nr:Ger(x)C family spore germination protein [Ureibacillus xyleni]SOC15079.1 Ger(x)C family germination protein [Ureibacillus xyleni]